MLDEALAQVAAPVAKLTACHDANDRDAAAVVLAGMRMEIRRVVLATCVARLAQSPPQPERDAVNAIRANPGRVIEHAITPVAEYVERAFAVNDAADDALADVFG